MNEVLQYFAPEGVWAVLSCILIFYILRSQEKRDEKQDERDKQYQKTIMMLSESLNDLQDIKEILKEKLN